MGNMASFLTTGRYCTKHTAFCLILFFLHFAHGFDSSWRITLRFSQHIITFHLWWGRACLSYQRKNNTCNCICVVSPVSWPSCSLASITVMKSDRHKIGWNHRALLLHFPPMCDKDPDEKHCAGPGELPLIGSADDLLSKGHAPTTYMPQHLRRDDLSHSLFFLTIWFVGGLTARVPSVSINTGLSARKFGVSFGHNLIVSNAITVLPKKTTSNRESCMYLGRGNKNGDYNLEAAQN